MSDQTQETAEARAPVDLRSEVMQAAREASDFCADARSLADALNEGAESLAIDCATADANRATEAMIDVDELRAIINVMERAAAALEGLLR